MSIFIVAIYCDELWYEPTCNVMRDVGSWHIASFRCAAEFDRYRGIADIDQSRFMSTALEHRRPEFTSAFGSVAGHGRNYCWLDPVANDPTVWTGRALQAECE